MGNCEHGVECHLCPLCTFGVMANNVKSGTIPQSEPETLTLEKLREVIDSIPKDPLAEWMKAEGFDPKKGGKLYLPISMRKEMGSIIPYYAAYSHLIVEPILVNDIFSTPLITRPFPRETFLKYQSILNPDMSC